MSIITPGGMSAKSIEKWTRGLHVSGFKQTARVPSRFGDIYLAEKHIGDSTKVWWAARDMVQEVEFTKGVSKVRRKNEALALALITLKLREAQFKELN